MASLLMCDTTASHYYECSRHLFVLNRSRERYENAIDHLKIRLQETQ